MRYNILIVVIYSFFSVAVFNQIIAADKEFEREIQRVRTVYSNTSRTDRNTDINNNDIKEPDRNSVSDSRR